MQLFQNPNFLAGFLMIGVTMAFGMLFIKKYKLPVKIILAVCVGVISIAVVSSFSRGGWLSTAAAVFVIILLHRRWSYFVLMLCLLIITLTITSIKFPHIMLSALERFTTIFNPAETASSSRLSLIRTGIWIWQDHPILGVGVGGFPYYVFDYLDPDVPRTLANIKEAHTLQFKILAEVGIIGLTIAVWFFFTVLFDGIRSIKTMKDDTLKTIQIGLVALFVGYITNFTFASDLLNNIFWITVGVIYAVPLVDKKIVNVDTNYQSLDVTLSANDGSSCDDP